MPISIKAILTATAVAFAAAGCGDFLDETDDPNNPVVASRDHLFIGTQASTFGQQEGILAIIACAWMQQCTGTSNFLESIEIYEVELEELQNPGWATAFEGGGLVDQRQIQASALADGDLQYLAMAQFYEALNIGTVASVWGDVPYRQAANVDSFPTPVLDPQLQVYADVQALLSEALTNLDGAGPGPGIRDLVYGGDVVKWKEAVHTLKARYYMHTAEVEGATAYQNAIDEATLGISSADNDFRSFHGSSNQEANMWNQFQVFSGFGGFLVAGRHLVDVMLERDDPRLAEYFGTTMIDVTPKGPSDSDTAGYVGQDPNGKRSDSTISGASALTGTRAIAEFRQPILSYAENQLILAEAKFQLSGSAAALPHVNAVRSLAGLLPFVGVLTLEDIMEEKYVALYQNIEVWNDYKRTCQPELTAFETDRFNNLIPGRLFYSATEENANPNIPTESIQLTNGGLGFRNANDPNPCPIP